MSKLSLPNSRAEWTSKSSFEALGVESAGEETEDDELVTPPTPPPESGSLKPSKSALKKAKAMARLEKQQQQKAARAAARQQAAQARGAAPKITHDAEPGSPTNPLEIPNDSESDVAGPIVKQPAVVQVDAPPPPSKHTNGDAHVPSEGTGHSKPTSSTAPTAPYPTAKIPESAPEPLQSPQKLMAEASANEPPSHELSARDAESAKKKQNALTRTLWTFIMIGGFITLLLLGHAYMVILVMLCQTLVYREVTALFSIRRVDEGVDNQGKRMKDPWSKTLNWYFFAVTNYFLYGESIIYYFKHVVFSDAQLTAFATNHRFISFTLYTIGFVGFVMSLKRGYLKQQFGLFCWVHMTLLLIVVSSHFIVNNILEGLIWFWVPASLVICNDVFAYIWGITIGRTPLIKLSPKKTVEGFVGAFFSTIIFGIVWGTWFMRYNYMICPVHDLGVSAWSGVQCTPNPVFVWQEWEMWAPLRLFFSALLGHQVTSIPYTTYQFHLLVMSCFASLVAPFGGFFASGFKRAFNIKDFGHSIPGHGGMTDRMDCQFLMGVFTYVYYSSIIRDNHVTIGSLLQMIVSGLTVNEQLELMGDLKRYLEGQGIAVKL